MGMQMPWQMLHAYPDYPVQATSDQKILSKYVGIKLK